jgi:hypothetical protein
MMLERESLALIIDSLELTDVLPAMLYLEPVTVSLPKYQVALLRHLAEREHMSVDDWLQRLLRDVAREHDLPTEGYTNARDFPTDGE